MGSFRFQKGGVENRDEREIFYVNCSICRRNDLDYNSGDDWKDGSFFSGDERGENASLDVEENLVSIMILFLAMVPI